MQRPRPLGTTPTLRLPTTVCLRSDLYEPSVSGHEVVVSCGGRWILIDLGNVAVVPGKRALSIKLVPASSNSYPAPCSSWLYIDCTLPEC